MSVEAQAGISRLGAQVLEELKFRTATDFSAMKMKEACDHLLVDDQKVGSSGVRRENS
jgi:hypothetical protein